MIIYLAALLTVAFLSSLYQAFWALLLLPLLKYPNFRFPLILFLLGVLVAVSYGGWQLHHRLPLSLDRSELLIQGHVASLPEINEQRVRFIFALDQLQSDQAEFKRLRRVRINLYRFGQTEPFPTIRSGDQLTLRVSLRSPHFLNNPDAFDLERHFFSSGWDASATILEVIDQNKGRNVLYLYRDALRNALMLRFQDTDAAWLLPAITLGDRTAISADRWEVLQRTGTAHLLVVSGLHVAVISGTGILIGRFIVGVFLIMGIDRTYLRALPLLLGFVLATVYAFLAGFNIPVQRAWIMVSVFLLGEWRLLKLSGWMRWRIAVVLVMTHSPLAIIQPGAWMSFIAVALLLLMTDAYRSVRRSGVMTLLRAQWMIFIGLIPVMAWVFQQLSLTAPVVNMVAIPLFSFFVMALPLILPLALFDVVWCEWLIYTFLHHFWLSLVHISDFSMGFFHLEKPSLLLLIATLPLWLLLLVPLPWRWKMMALIVFLPIMLPRQTLLAPGDFRAIVFDVGQGLAVLVETRDHLLIYDTGPGYPNGGSAWGFAVAPWFNARNFRSLTDLVISHRDLDHAGGMSALFEQLTVARQTTGSSVLQQQGFENCHQLQQWSYHQVAFRFLTDLPAVSANENEQSCVLEVRNAQCALLLPGDVGHSTEYDLIRSRRLKPVNWLVAGHHGSASSSSDVFIEYLNPNAVIYTAGFANQYGHPAEVVTERFKNRNIDEYNTATAGAVWLEAINGQCRVSTQRSRKRRYWTNG